jgi:hypothetical protein
MEKESLDQVNTLSKNNLLTEKIVSNLISK